MEIYQLKYFVAVAKLENIHKAGAELSVSPPAISRAISNLEHELGLKLFERVGRSIRLSMEGRQFEKRAREIIELIATAAHEIKSQPEVIQFSIAGREILLGHYGLRLIELLKREFKKVEVTFLSCSGEEAIRYARNGTALFAITTQGPFAELRSKSIDTFESRVYVGKTHPCYLRAKERKPISLSEVLEFDFISPNAPVFGRIHSRASFDGWRDDLFPRKIEYITASMHLFHSMVKIGACMAYLPSFYQKEGGLLPLEITGAHFKSAKTVYLSTAKSSRFGWVQAFHRCFEL